MVVDIEAYKTHYHQNEKFIDNWQEGVKLLPFNSNPASAVDKCCGLLGTTGEFFRIWNNDGSKPIEDFQKSALDPVFKYLTEQRQISVDQAKEF